MRRRNTLRLVLDYAKTRAVSSHTGYRDGSLAKGAEAVFSAVWNAVCTLLMISAWRILGLDLRRAQLYDSRWALLEASLAAAPTSGLRMEFGVYRGESLDFIASKTDSVVFGFDSFRGLEADWTRAFPKGSFDTMGARPPVRENVRLIAGLFGDTLPPFLEEHQGEVAAFVHVDCDLYSSALGVLMALAPHLSEGSIVVFDEFVTLYPDDESRALRDIVRRSGVLFGYVGAALSGSVAIRIVGKSRSGGPGFGAGSPVESGGSSRRTLRGGSPVSEID